MCPPRSSVLSPLSALAILFGCWLPTAARPEERPAAHYHNAVEMASLLEELADHHRGLVKLHRYGKSYEKRDLWAAELSDTVGKADGRPGVCLVAAVQGDEAGASEVALG